MQARPGLVPSVLRRLWRTERAAVTQTGTMVDLNLVRVDYANPLHAKALVDMLDGYARDPAGGAKPLSDFVRANLVGALAARPQAFSVQGVGVVHPDQV